LNSILGKHLHNLLNHSSGGDRAVSNHTANSVVFLEVNTLASHASRFVHRLATCRSYQLLNQNLFINDLDSESVNNSDTSFFILACLSSGVLFFTRSGSDRNGHSFKTNSYLLVPLGTILAGDLVHSSSFGNGCIH